MTSDNEEEQLPESSTGVGDSESTTPVDSADATSREPSDVSETAEKGQPKPSKRQLLVKELSQPTKAEREEDEDTEEAEEEETEVEAGDSQDTEAKPSKSEETEISTHDTSDRRSKAREKFEKLTTHNRELKDKLDKATPFAQYGESMFNFCRDAGIPTEKLGLWLTVAADAEKNPAGARATLEKMGLKVEPVREVVKEIPQELEDALLDMTTQGQVAPEAFKALVGMIRKARASTPAPTPQPHVPAAQATQPPASTAAPKATDPNKAIYDQKLAKAVADIDSRDIELAAKYPADWAKMKAQITEAFKRYRGTDPALWVGFFEDELNKVVAKAKRPAAPTSKAPIRPSTTSSAQSKPTSKVASLKADLVAGKIR